MKTYIVCETKADAEALIAEYDEAILDEVEAMNPDAVAWRQVEREEEQDGVTVTVRVNDKSDKRNRLGVRARNAGSGRLTNSLTTTWANPQALAEDNEGKYAVVEPPKWIGRPDLPNRRVDGKKVKNDRANKNARQRKTELELKFKNSGEAPLIPEVDAEINVEVDLTP